MKAAVLGIGTELTSGQITNKNAVWISKYLKTLGVPTSVHLTVPDERALILDSLNFCAERADTLFITGGLGPTTDDFTREVVAEWTKKELRFDEASWVHIQERLRSRSVEIRETQKRQCYYPEGATIIANPQGTANAFQLKYKNIDVFVLPGPPREIEACWQSGIASFLENKSSSIDREVTYSWDTMGYGESDVSHIVETCLQGVQVEKGYRVHMPYVEVKMTFNESRRAELAGAVESVDRALAAMTVVKNGGDLATALAAKIAAVEVVEVIDTCTKTALFERLQPLLKAQLKWHRLGFANSLPDRAPAFQSLRLVLKDNGDGHAIAEFYYRGMKSVDHFSVPTFLSTLPDRRAMYFAERAMIFWNQKMTACLS